MKNIALILFFTMSVSVFCQTKTMKSTDWVYDYECGQKDTLGTGDSIWYQEIYFPKHGDGLLYSVYVDVDSIGGTSGPANEYLFIIKGKANESATYVALDTVSYAGTADTTFTMAELSTAVKYKYIMLYVEGEADELAIELQKVEFSFFK